MTGERAKSICRKIGAGAGGFLTFVVALGLMKEGARGLAPLLQNALEIRNAADSLGFGWLMASLVLSGSPVAAAAVSLLSAGVLSPPQAFTMISGSRLGAGFIVLLMGLIYALRGHERWTALSAGVLSFIITGSIQVLVIPVGLGILSQGLFDHASIPLRGVADVIGLVLGPVVSLLSRFLPEWALFVAGVALITLSFRLFDQALPQLRLEETTLNQIPRLIYRAEVMFLLGFAVTLVTMSVSVSIGILVPLSARGYMRRENIIPYIQGANISTLVDTLVAAALLGNGIAVSVVLVQMFCTAAISLAIILIAYLPYERMVSRALSWVVRSKRNFVIFAGAICVIPLMLLLF